MASNSDLWNAWLFTAKRKSVFDVTKAGFTLCDRTVRGTAFGYIRDEPMRGATLMRHNSDPQHSAATQARWRRIWKVIAIKHTERNDTSLRPVSHYAAAPLRQKRIGCTLSHIAGKSLSQSSAPLLGRRLSIIFSRLLVAYQLKIGKRSKENKKISFHWST